MASAVGFIVLSTVFMPAPVEAVSYGKYCHSLILILLGLAAFLWGSAILSHLIHSSCWWFVQRTTLFSIAGVMEEAGTIKVADAHMPLRHNIFRADVMSVCMHTAWLSEVSRSIFKSTRGQERPQIQGCTSYACSLPGSVIAGLVVVSNPITR